jgi:hypothetical protein
VASWSVLLTQDRSALLELQPKAHEIASVGNGVGGVRSVTGDRIHIEVLFNRNKMTNFHFQSVVIDLPLKFVNKKLDT